MSKRDIDELLEESVSKKPKIYEHIKKHTLDSDEEDSDVDESRLVYNEKYLHIENHFILIFFFSRS